METLILKNCDKLQSKRITSGQIGLVLLLVLPLLVLSLAVLFLNLLIVPLASILGGVVITCGRYETMLRTLFPSFYRMPVFLGNPIVVTPLRWSLRFLSERQKRVLFAVTLVP